MTCSLLYNEMNQMHMACYRLVHYEYIRTIVCYRIGAIIFRIVTVNMEYHFIVLNYRSLFVFQILIVSAAFSSSRFCWVLCSLSFYLCQRSSWVCVFYNLPSFAIAVDWDSNLRLGIRIFTWDPHICRCVKPCSFTTVKLVSNY